MYESLINIVQLHCKFIKYSFIKMSQKSNKTNNNCLKNSWVNKT